MPDVTVRAWRDGDEEAVATLLAPDAEPLWVAQGHTLHGPDRPAPRWRRTWLACRGLWVHESWLPVGSREALEEVATRLVAEADLTHGAVAWAGGRPAALVLAFGEADGILLAAETVRREEPDGADLLAAAVGHALRTAADAGLSNVTFDGHESDPHLAPLVGELPTVTTRPLLLVEVP